LFIVLDLLLLQLLLEMRVPQHVVLAEAIDFEVWMAHHEPAVINGGLSFYLFGPVLVDYLLNFLLAPFGQVCVLQLIPQFVVQFFMHEIAVHMFFKHPCVY
jgi:hypothetical protein